MSEGLPLTGGSPARGRVLTVPNALSVLRLACVPLFLWLLFHHEEYPAAWLLGGLGTTDWVDGYIARHFNQVSELGKILDPTADRLLLLAGITGILIHHAAPLWVGAAVLLREALVAGAALVLAGLGARRIDVQWAGKAGTFGCMVAFPLFLVGHSDAFWRRPAEWAAWVVVLPALMSAWYAAATYVPIARAALAQGRAARLGQSEDADQLR